MISNVYRNVQNGNYSWNVSLGAERNHNSLTIHSNNMGKTIFETEEIWDTDVFKIVRILAKYEYSRMNITDIIKKINKECRHLEIPSYIR